MLLLALAACATDAPPTALLDDATPMYTPPEAECDARWLPDSCTEAVAAGQWVDYASAVECTGSAQPGATRLAEHLMATFAGPSGYGIYDCRDIQGGGALSLHAEGRAIDLMIPMDWSQPYGANNAVGDPVAAWLMEHAEEIGIQSFTWDRTIFYGDEDPPKHHCVSIENGHWDHLHIELSWDAAYELTPWFNPPSEPAASAENAAAAMPTVTPIGGVGGVVTVSPTRLFDTRQDATSTGLVRADGSVSGPLDPGAANTWADWSALPADAESAWLNVTAIGGTEAGYIAAAPADMGMPGTSTVNHSCRQPVRANGTPIGVEGAAAFWSLWSIDAIADVSAAFAPSGDGVTLVRPTRVLDSRTTSAFTAGEVRAVDISCSALGAACVDGDERGALATVTVVGGDVGGYVTAFPCGSATPDVSLVNFEAAAIVANATAVGLGDGQLCLYSAAPAHIIVDVSGIVTPGGEVGWQAVAPVRLLDTRASGGRWEGRTGGGQVLTVPVGSLAGMPAGVRGAVLNLTTVEGDGTGFLTVYPCDAGVPDASAVNWTREDATAAVTSTPVSATDGSVCVYAGGRTHVIVDLLGVWVDRPESGGETGGETGGGGDSGGGDSGGSGDNGGGGDNGGDSGEDVLDTGAPGEASTKGAAGCGCAAGIGDGGGGGASALGVALAALVVRRRR